MSFHQSMEEFYRNSTNNIPPTQNMNNDAVILTVQRRHEHARIPQRATQFAAGYDLFSAEERVIAPHSQMSINTGISIALPPRTCGRIAPRSGLALRNSINVHAGIIDEDYRGEILVILYNHGNSPLNVQVGDRIAQLLIVPVLYPEIRIVSHLPATERGQGGFGSTGV
jgi:dUTP pyrophosphatase